MLIFYDPRLPGIGMTLIVTVLCAAPTFYYDRIAVTHRAEFFLPDTIIKCALSFKRNFIRYIKLHLAQLKRHVIRAPGYRDAVICGLFTSEPFGSNVLKHVGFNTTF